MIPNDDLTWEVFKRESDKELDRRMDLRKQWDDLKADCANALRKAGYDSPTLKPQSRIMLDAVQDDSVREAKDIGFKNFDEWASAKALPLGGVMNTNASAEGDPDQFSEEDTVWNKALPMVNYEGKDLERAEVILKQVDKVLNERERVIYRLKIDQQYTNKAVASVLKVSERTIEREWPKIESKLRDEFKRLRGE